jgi:hypothetical protein
VAAEYGGGAGVSRFVFVFHPRDAEGDSDVARHVRHLVEHGLAILSESTEKALQPREPSEDVRRFVDEWERWVDNHVV